MGDFFTITRLAVGYAKSTRGDAPDPATSTWKNGTAGYLTEEDGRRWAVVVIPSDGEPDAQQALFADVRRFLDTGETPANCSPEQMVVIVCGGRRGQEQAIVSRALDAWHTRRPLATVIHGACEDQRKAGIAAPGNESEAIARDGEASGWSADMCADRWARARGVPVESMPADWYPDGVTLDRSAGPRRNAAMLNALIAARDAGRPVAVLAFTGGRGTEGMVTLAKAADVPTWNAAGSMWVRA